MSAGNCRLLGKLSCQVRHSMVGLCLERRSSLGSLLMFTRLRSRETEEWGGGVESPQLPQKAQKPLPSEAPLRALPETRFRSDIYKGLISILWTSRFDLLLIGCGVPVECPYQSAPEPLASGPDEGGPCAVTGTDLCFRGLLFFSIVEGPGGGRRLN